MKISIPTTDSNEMNSQLCGHFGSAPFFTVVDLEKGTCVSVANDNSHHEHGQCRPLAAFGDSLPDAIVCQGIGAGAITKLAAAGVKVYRVQASIVSEAVEKFEKGLALPMSVDDACRSHNHHHPA